MKPKLRELQTCNYDKHWGPNGRFTDWVTESLYFDDKSLTEDEFLAIVNANHNVAGALTLKKYKMTYGDGSVIYRHVLEEVMY